MVSMLSTLNISKAVDEHGRIVEPVVKFENPIFRYVLFAGLSNHEVVSRDPDYLYNSNRTPSLFKCDMRPRSQKALSLIKQSEIHTA